jgi:NAD(P)-dependent dehydrogenase (short-subunit alcohol dehydrogenase family)
MSGLQGGTAVVTGAGSGLGAAMAGAFAAEGMAVAVLDINREAAESVAAGLEAGGAPALGRAVDVADRETLDAAAAEVAARFGACNVVAANVGVMQFGPLERITADDWQWLLSLNVVGTANTVNAFLPSLRAADGPRHVVLTSSMAALVSDAAPGRVHHDQVRDHGIWRRAPAGARRRRHRRDGRVPERDDHDAPREQSRGATVGAR